MGLTAADRALRGVEVGTRALWGVLAAVIVYALWKKFRPAPIVRTEILPPLGPVSGPDLPGPPLEQSEPEGIVSGGLVSSVQAQLIQPAEGARVYRKLLRSVFDAELEVVNESDSMQDVQVEIVATFYEYSGTVRPNVRTLLPAVVMAPGDVHRFQIEVETDNLNNLLYEVGQADAVVQVYVNGKVTQTTRFEVW